VSYYWKHPLSCIALHKTVALDSTFNSLILLTFSDQSCWTRSKHIFKGQVYSVTKYQTQVGSVYGRG